MFQNNLKRLCRKLSILFLIFLLISESSYLSAQGKSQTLQQDVEPEWIKDTPLVYIGNWDSFPLFKRRMGSFPPWQEEEYYKQHTEESVRKLKEMGVTLAIIHFYKAFGIEAEKEHMVYAKQLSELCHKYDIKVGVYVGSTFGYEHFLLEKPEAKEWIVPDYRGEPVTYGSQLFRKRPYFMHPGYREYIKKVLRIAIEDFKADLIHFDNPANQGVREVFHHPLAVENFKEYLRNKYSPNELKERMGLSDVTYIEPPVYESPLSTIEDPLFQEWTDFRCQQLADYYGEMADYIRKLNPEVAVENNPHGLTGINTMWEQSIDFPRLLKHMDFFWTEGEDTKLEADGTLVSKIRTFKMARTLDTRVFTYTSESILEMAEALAYNRQGMGMVGNGLAGYEASEQIRQWIKFFHDNFDHYRDVKNVADVAILHSYSTMAYNNDRPYQSTFLFEQALIQAKIPFDIIFDQQLEDLSKYKVLVLADQEALNQNKINLINQFVKEGGGLVATEHTSLYNEPRERRKEFGLQTLFQIEPPEWKRGATSDALLENAPVRNQIGKGRVIYISEVKPSFEKPPTAAMLGKYWKLPVNWWELIKAVQWASQGKLSIDINAPLTVTMELNMQSTTGNMILHLVNFDSENQNDVKNIDVSLQLNEGGKVSSVLLLSPEFDQRELEYFIEEGKVKFVVPNLTTYDVVVIKKEKK